MAVLMAFARRTCRTAAAAILAGAPLMLSDVPSSAATVFATPEDALHAFRRAIDSEGGKGLLDLFGKEHEADLIGGDPAEARQNVLTLRRMAGKSMTLMPDGEGRMIIVMGSRGWPMPVPLEQGPSGWAFDVKAGMQEITDRRVMSFRQSPYAGLTLMHNGSMRRSTTIMTACLSSRSVCRARKASTTASTGSRDRTEL